MKKYITVLFLLVMIVPSIAFASWWNPFSWFNGWNFHKIETTIDNSTQKNTVPNDIEITSGISNKITIPSVSPKQNNPTVVEKTTPQKDAIKTKQPPKITPTPSENCIEGSFLDKTTGGCINYLTYCQNQNGLNATYNSIKNSCECSTGYTLNSSGTCAIIKTGYQICSDQFPNETWDGTITNGKYNCVCQTGYVLNNTGTGCQIDNSVQINAQNYQAKEEKLAPLKLQFTQIINDINTDCNNAYAGHPVAVCMLTESKLQTILEREAEIGISKEEAAPQLRALQDAYNKLQTEYYSVAGMVADMQYINGIQKNIAAEMQILANYKAMFTN